MPGDRARSPGTLGDVHVVDGHRTVKGCPSIPTTLLSFIDTSYASIVYEPDGNVTFSDAVPCAGAPTVSCTTLCSTTFPEAFLTRTLTVPSNTMPASLTVKVLACTLFACGSMTQ